MINPRQPKQKNGEQKIEQGHVPTNPTSQKTSKQSLPEDCSLGITIEQFAKNLNALRTPLTINTIDLNRKDDGMLHFSFKIRDNIGIAGRISERDNTLYSLTLSMRVQGIRDEKIKSATDVLITPSVITQAMNPDIDKDSIGNMTYRMFRDSSKVPDQPHFEQIGRNVYVMSYSPSRNTFFMLYADP